ncbi:hypothetical protein SPRG_16729, partial [Saprolegnia parasitica CBS 223.65]
MALANLAAASKHPTMIARGVLKVVLRLATAPRDDIRQYAAFALANFAGNAEHCNTIGDEGGVAPLIALAHSEDPNAHTLAIAALRRLCQVSATNRGRIVRGGGLVPLALAGHSEELETQREVAATLCNLSLSDEYKMEIVLSGALPPLITLGQSPDVEVARQACGAIANLAEKIETHATFAAAHGGRPRARWPTSSPLFGHHGDMIAEGLPGLIHLALSVDTECQYNAALALRKLAPNTASHRGIVCEGGLKSLLFLLESKETNIRKHAVVALRDVASNAAYQVRFYEEGGVSALVTFVRDVEPNLQCPALAALRHLSCATELKKPIVQAGILRPLLKCINPAGHHVDLLCQCAGLLANLSEHLENQLTMVEEGATTGLVALGHIDHDEIQQDVARALANLSANEDNHSTIYKQGGLKCLIGLTRSKEEVCQRYAAMGLRFLASNPTIRVHIVQENLLPPFLALAQSPVLDYQRTAASAFCSFSLNEENKMKLVRDGGLTQILKCMRYEDLEVTRDCTFALATSPTRGIATLVHVGAHDDARVQRDTARALASLSVTAALKPELMTALPTLFRLARSLDVSSQRYSTLAICNLASGPDKVAIVETGAVRPLLHLVRFPDHEIQRYAALALAGLALSDHGHNKLRMVTDGAVRPLVEMLRYPSVEIQKCGCLALNALTLGKHAATKLAVLQEDGLLPLLALLSASDIECVRIALYCVGSIAEHMDVLTKLLELGALVHIVHHSRQPDLEVKRNCGYILALAVEHHEFHDDFVREGGMQIVVHLASIEDIECQEYATFALAHLVSNREYQVKLGQHGRAPTADRDHVGQRRAAPLRGPRFAQARRQLRVPHQDRGRRRHPSSFAYCARPLDGRRAAVQGVHEPRAARGQRDQCHAQGPSQ